MTSLLEKRLFLLPAVLIVFFVMIFPFVHTVMLSFSDASFFRPSPIHYFSTVSNWTTLVDDVQLRQTLVNTLIFLFGGLALQYPLGFGIALLLNRTPVIGRNFFQSAFIIPMLISPIAAGFIIGRMMFHPSIGPINDMLQRVGLPGVTWLSNSISARVVLILIDSWKWTPFFMLFLLAGLEALPKEPYEAARVDGANSWQVFRYIIFPQLLPISVVVVAIRALMIIRNISLPKIVTAGGPGTTTMPVAMYAYNRGMGGGDVAYGAAVALALLIAAIILMLAYLSLVRRLIGVTKL